MDNIKKLMYPMLQEDEGFRESVYTDSHGYPTIGTGFNLKDDEVRGLLSLHGKDPQKLESGEMMLDKETNDLIKDKIMDRKLELTRGKVGPELWDTLSDNQKATIGTLGYQSLNNIGPNLRNALINNDVVGAVREIAGNTNASQNPGIQYRRLKQAQQYAGEEFPNILSGLDKKTKRKILDNLTRIENPNTRKEALDAYEQYLKDLTFKRLLTSK